MVPRTQSIGLLAALCISLGCGDDSTQPDHRVAATVLVRPDSQRIRIDHNLQMYAMVLDSTGDTLVDRAVTWTSSDSDLVAVSAWGLATGRAPGAVTITATADSVSGNTQVRVLIPVKRVDISPLSVMLVPGGTIKMTARLTGTDGSTLSDRDITWNHEATVSIAPTGMMKGLQTGSDSITATSEGIAEWSPARVTVTRPQLTRVVANHLSEHVCALTAPGEAYCWGSNSAGSLGNGTFGDSVGNVRYGPPPTTGGLAYPTGIPYYVWSDLGVGEDQTCGVFSGQVACWGVNDEYSLGNGPGDNQSSPRQVALPRAATSVVTGEEWACGLGTDSLPYCWGGSVTGFLIDPTVFPNRKYVAIVAGYNTLCGVGADSLAYCGFPQTSGQSLVSPSLKFTKLTVGQNHICGLTADSAAYCWGQNAFGQLGDSTTTGRFSPAVVAGGFKFVDLAAGDYFTCGVVASVGAGYCWGIALSLQSTNPPQITTAPSLVPGNLVFSQITAGRRFACGIATGKVYCWGRNQFGQLGDGTWTDRFVPVLVAGQP